MMCTNIRNDPAFNFKERKSIMKKTLGKRLLSGITSALLTLSYLTPSLPFVSTNAADIPNKSDSSVTISDAELLAGKNSPLRGTGDDDTMQTVIDNANDTYALGIASQFCVFVETDFIPHDSDVEGRMAIGGNFDASKMGSKEYEVGNGDYNTEIHIDNLLKNSGFAHAIINGNSINGLIPASWKNYKYSEEGKADKYITTQKRFWVNSGASITAPSNFTSNGGDRWNGDYDSYFYEGPPIFDVKAEFKELKSRSKAISKQVTPNTKVTIDEDEMTTDAYGDPAKGVAHLIY